MKKSINIMLCVAVFLSSLGGSLSAKEITCQPVGESETTALASLEANTGSQVADVYAGSDSDALAAAGIILIVLLVCAAAAASSGTE